MDEHDPVDDGEFVFRRIHRSFYTPGVATPVWPWAFRPNANDTTGISVFRASFGPPASILATLDPAKAQDYYVARLSVAALRILGLTVEPDPVLGARSDTPSSQNCVGPPIKRRSKT
jgi:hypothetical protein